MRSRAQVARLIPITSSTGGEAKERNAASALFAVLAHVDEFGRILLKPLGAPAGKIERSPRQSSGLIAASASDGLRWPE